MANPVAETITAINAVTQTTTSAAIDVSGFEAISVNYIRADHSSGNTVFSVEVSNDGTTWATFNMLIDNVANTNGEQITRVASKTLSANGDDFVFIGKDTPFKYMRVKGTRTTDGTNSVVVHISYGNN